MLARGPYSAQGEPRKGVRLVSHYQKRGAGIRYWEIVNEPDIGEDGGCPYRFSGRTPTDSEASLKPPWSHPQAIW